KGSLDEGGAVPAVGDGAADMEVAPRCGGEVEGEEVRDPAGGGDDVDIRDLAIVDGVGGLDEEDAVDAAAAHRELLRLRVGDVGDVDRLDRRLRAPVMGVTDERDPGGREALQREGPRPEHATPGEGVLLAKRLREAPFEDDRVDDEV